MSIRAHSFICSRALCLMVLAASVVFTTFAQAQVNLIQLSEDTFTDTPSQHATEVEPGTFSYGSTIVSAFQVARIWIGGGRSPSRDRIPPTRTGLSAITRPPALITAIAIRSGTTRRRAT